MLYCCKCPLNWDRGLLFDIWFNIHALFERIKTLIMATTVKIEGVQEADCNQEQGRNLCLKDFEEAKKFESTSKSVIVYKYYMVRGEIGQSIFRGTGYGPITPKPKAEG